LLAGEREPGWVPDLICLGKGLGGGLPISACLGKKEWMAAWSRVDEVVHTSTFAGAPLACTSALATLDVLTRGRLIEDAAAIGQPWIDTLRELIKGTKVSEVRGS